MEGRIARSAELRQAHLAGRVQKAVEETKKVCVRDVLRKGGAPGVEGAKGVGGGSEGKRVGEVTAILWVGRLR